MTTPLDPGYGFSQPEPEPQPEPAVRPAVLRRRPRRVLFVALLTIGVLLIAGGAAAVVRELTRAATSAEATAALQQEIATRWQRIPAGKIFPATTRYSDADGNAMLARLVGIAPPASCRAGVEPADYKLVRGLGCVTMLRATYVDASGTLAITVGIAVLRSPAAARQASNVAVSLAAGDGLHALAFSGTITDQFGDAARGVQGGLASGPYAFLYTAGFTDGQPTTAAVQEQSELQSFGNSMATGLEGALTGHGKPCNMKDITC